MEQEELNPDGITQQNKAKKNLVYIGMFSVVMFFAGLTSAYIVSMGDSFWVKTELPQAFWISTVIIILSSVAFQIAVRSSRKGNSKGLKLGVLVTFILGLMFIYFQFKGYGALSELGVRVNQELFVDEGYYGYDEVTRLGYYDVKYKDQLITSDGYEFFIDGKPLPQNVKEGFKAFMGQFADEKYTMWDAMTDKSLRINEFLNDSSDFQVTPSADFKLIYRDQSMTVDNGVLYLADSSEIKRTDKLRLRNLANNIRDDRGDFFVKGKMGEDFHVIYRPAYIETSEGERVSNKEKGNYYELEYVNRRLKYKGMDGYLTENDLRKATEAADTSSAYLWIITFAHLMHIVITMLYLLRVVIRSFTGRITPFWHFLGALWLYLLLFLLFIH
jgi:cytochrome c oxidase subunit 3